MTDIRTIPCDVCGGDGGWSYPVSHDPFRDVIRYAHQECTACGGTGEIEVEFAPVDLDDLDARDDERREFP